MAQRRGTYVGPYRRDTHVYVRWDDQEEVLAELYARDPEYQEHVRANGQLVATGNICKVRSAAFGDTFA